MNVESVSWASERKNLLATLFFFLSFHQYIQYRKTSARLNFLLSVFCFLLSLLSKASTVVAPLVFLAYDFSFKERKLLQLRLYDKLPFIILAEIHTFFSIHAAGAHRALNSYHHGGSLLSAFASGHLFEEYFKLLLFPANLSGFYYPRESPSFVAVGYWLPLLLCIAALVLLARLSRAVVLLVRLVRHSDDSCSEHRAAAYSDGKSVSLRFGGGDLGAACDHCSVGVDPLPPVSHSARGFGGPVGWLACLARFPNDSVQSCLEEQRTVSGLMSSTRISTTRLRTTISGCTT